MVLDLSAFYHSAALGILMTCATAWLQQGLGGVADASGRDGSTASARGGVIVVVDEAWAILANLGVARWLQSSWKLARARGVSNVAVLHRLSDLETTGAVGSEQVGLSRGLLSDSETRVVYAQPPGEIEQEAIVNASMQQSLSKGNWMWCMCKPMRSARKDDR